MQFAVDTSEVLKKMRHGRAKQARRTLQFFQRTTGLRSPYNILIDGTFTVAMLQSKLPLMERLDRLLQHGARYQLFITQSSLQELETLSKHKVAGENAIFQEAHKWATEYCQVLADMPIAPPKLDDIKLHFQEGMYDEKDGRKRQRKKQRDSPLDLTVAQNDILRLVTDAVSSPAETKQPDRSQKESASPSIEKKKEKQRQLFFVASQDETVLGLLRYFTIPLIRLARGSVLLLEQPSKIIQTIDRNSEQQKWGGASQVADGTISRPEKDLLEIVSKQETAQKEADAKPVVFGARRTSKKRKARAPNPLSCKKASGESSKRRRKPKSAES